jgi:hypothetical protein
MTPDFSAEDGHLSVPTASPSAVLVSTAEGNRYVFPRGPSPVPEGFTSEAKTVSATPLASQVGGDHYKKLGIQPVEFAHANSLDFFQGNIVKYTTRWRDKGGLADLRKAKHMLELYIELEEKKRG